MDVKPEIVNRLWLQSCAQADGRTTRELVQHFARLLADEVREECAKVCEAERVEFEQTKHPSDEAYNIAVKHCAAAIRAMKEGKE